MRKTIVISIAFILWQLVVFSQDLRVVQKYFLVNAQNGSISFYLINDSENNVSWSSQYGQFVITVTPASGELAAKDSILLTVNYQQNSTKARRAAMLHIKSERTGHKLGVSIHQSQAISSTTLKTALTTSQTSEDPTLPKYNPFTLPVDKGMTGGGNIIIDGHEAINDYDGSLSLNYSSNVFLPNDIGGDFSIFYNSNVVHKYFLNENYYSNCNAGGYSVNYPEWLIGYKGIALQALSFEESMNQNYLIDGYHFSNPVGTITSTEYTKYKSQVDDDPECLDKSYFCYGKNAAPDPDKTPLDMIKILRTDGSAIQLCNSQLPGAISKYYAYGLDAIGYALVEQIPNSEGCRRLKYIPGDGFIYTFEEEYGNYSGRLFFPPSGWTGNPNVRLSYFMENNSNSAIEWNWYHYICNASSNTNTKYWENRLKREPKIFYLKKINSNFGDEITFNYESNGSVNGRKRFSFAINGKTNDTLFALIYYRNSAGNYSSIKMINRLAGDTLSCQLVKDQNNYNKYYINTLRNNLNQITSINYLSNFCRNFQPSQADRIANGSTYFNIQSYIPLIDSVSYFNKRKTKFEYFNAPFDAPTAFYTNNSAVDFYDLGWSYEDYYMDNQPRNSKSLRNLVSAWRDNYSSYMLKRRKIYENSVFIREENYSYGLRKKSPYEYCPYEHTIDSIITTITVLNKKGVDKSLTSNSYTSEKKYSMFAIALKPFSKSDNFYINEIPYGKATKLMEETLFESPTKYRKKKFYYLVPVLQSNSGAGTGYNSCVNKKYYSYEYDFFSFELDSLVEISFENNKLQKNRKIYLYEYDEIPKNISPSEGNQYWLYSKTEKDINNYTKYMQYYNGSIVDTLANEKIAENCEYNPVNSLVFRLANTYNEKGKIDSVTYYSANNARNRHIKYEYYTDSNHEGYLKKIDFRNGLKYEITYPDQVSGGIPYYKVGYSGIKYNNTLSYNKYQFLPYKTDVKIGSNVIYSLISAYNGRGNMTFMIDENGLYSEFKYDALGRLVSRNLPGSFTSSGVSLNSTNYIYDDLNLKKTILNRISFNPLTNKTVDEYYNSNSQLSALAIQNEIKSTTTYNYLGLKAVESDALSRANEHRYDSFMRPVRISFSDSSFQKIEYAIGIDSTRSHIATILEKKTVTDERGNWSTEYSDVLGNKRYHVDYFGKTKYNYDNCYRLTNIISPMGKKTILSYDDLGNVAYRQSPDEGIVKTKYDKYGNIRFLLNTGTPASEKGLIFNSYDALGRKILAGALRADVDFNNLDPDMIYSNPQAPLHFENAQTDTGGITMVNMYDSYNPVGIFGSMGFVESSYLDYLKGKLVATAYRDKSGDPWNYKVYSYDFAGRVRYQWTKIAGTSWKRIMNSYDNLNNITSQIVDRGLTYDYLYDLQGRLTEVKSGYGSSRTDAKYYYNTANQIISNNFLNPSGQNIINLVNTYDQYRGWLSGISETVGNKFSETLLYNKSGEGLNIRNGNIYRTTISQNSATGWPSINFSYNYDEKNRLLSSECSSNANYSENYQYDNDGNIIQKLRNTKELEYTYVAGSNKLSRVEDNYSGKTYSIATDYRGNITSKADIPSGQQINFNKIDQRNLPLEVSTGTPGSTFVTYKYGYDDNGNRITRSGGGVNEYYLLDHTGKELGIYDRSTDRPKMFNIYGNGILGRVDVSWNYVRVPDDCGGETVIPTRTDSKSYYIKDHLGSIRQTIKETGTFSSARDYYPYGETLRAYVAGSANDKYQFTGKERDKETNFDYFGARYYDSEFARWNSVDPMSGKYPGWSSYNYCLNNPLKFVDPNGDTVRIYTGDGYLTYTPGMVYNGSNAFVAVVINSLNNMRSVQIGNMVLGSLVGSSNNFDFHNVSTSIPGTLQFSPADGGGGIIKAGSIMDIAGDGDRLRSISHELFHGYQQENGGIYGANSETEAYLFGNAVALNFSNLSGMGFSGNNTIAGTKWGDAMTSLLFAQSFDRSTFNNAASNFAAGNSYGNGYINFKYYPKFSPVINRFYPLVR